MTIRLTVATMAIAAAILVQPVGADEKNAIRWPSPIPDDCPFERSKDLGGIGLTGRHAEYTGAGYFFPTWAKDGHLYSGCGDGGVNGNGIWNAGIVKIVGEGRLVVPGHPVLRPKLRPHDASAAAGRLGRGPLRSLQTIQ